MIASTQTNHPLVAAHPDGKANGSLHAACEKLRVGGLRITEPRVAILGAMLRKDEPTSIEDIHALAGDDVCDLVTVYRCLGAFEEIGLVRRSFLHNGTTLFTVDLEGAKQYHVRCKETHRAEPLDAQTTTDLRRYAHEIEEMLRLRGYTSVSHVVEFFGVAPRPSRAR